MPARIEYDVDTLGISNTNGFNRTVFSDASDVVSPGHPSRTCKRVLHARDSLPRRKSNIEFSSPAASESQRPNSRLHSMFQLAPKGTAATICYVALVSSGLPGHGLFSVTSERVREPKAERSLLHAWLPSSPRLSGSSRHRGSALQLHMDSGEI